MKLTFLILVLAGSLSLAFAQVNPDDENIPVLGGRNDNPVSHPVLTPPSRNRVVFEKNNAYILKASRKRKSEMKEERQTSLDSINAKLLVSPHAQLTDCGVCLGTGISYCSSCTGSGFEECTICHGIKDKVCNRCNGSGYVFGQACSSCEATGLSVCKSCQGLNKICVVCKGAGFNHCKQCRGAGKVIAEDKNIH